jgi:hypothetical protein
MTKPFAATGNVRGRASMLTCADHGVFFPRQPSEEPVTARAR